MLPALVSPEDPTVRRKNPLAGSVSLGRLVVRELKLGDDDAIHDVRGQMVLDGDIDTVVLRVKENAELERTLLVRRLEVGAPGGDPYGSGGYASGGYPSGGYSSYGSSPGRGASIDEDGVVRTDAWAVIGDSDKGLVLRSPEGKYFGFTVGDGGRLSTTGTFLGWVEP